MTQATAQSFTLSEAGKLLRCSPETVRQLIHAGDLPGAFTIGRGTRRKRFRVPLSAIEAYQQANQVRPKGQRATMRRSVVKKTRRWV